MYQVGLAVADQVLSAELCQDPLPMLAAVIGVLATSEENPLQSEKDKA